jgi:hypothetical protein
MAAPKLKRIRKSRRLRAQLSGITALLRQTSTGKMHPDDHGAIQGDGPDEGRSPIVPACFLSERKPQTREIEYVGRRAEVAQTPVCPTMLAAGR